MNDHTPSRAIYDRAHELAEIGRFSYPSAVVEQIITQGFSAAAQPDRTDIVHRDLKKFEGSSSSDILAMLCRGDPAGWPRDTNIQ